MKIIIFTTHFYPYRGGLENYALQMALRLVKKGVKVDVLTFNHANLKDFEKYKGIGIYRIPCWNVLGVVYSIPRMNEKTKSILKKLARNNYDFVNTHTRFFASSWLGMKFAKENSIRLIHTEHGNVFVKHPNPIVEFFAWLYDMTIGRKIFKSAWKVVGVSKPCCRFAKKLGAKNCTVIHNCVDTGLFKKKKADLIKKLKIGKKTRVITFVGRVIHSKGIHDLINALEGINNAKLLVVGDGPYLNNLKKLANEKKVDALFLGSKSQEEIVDILNITDIFVNPSYSEGLPSSVLEAGAVGIPIIATNVGGTNEIIDNGINGLLVKPKNISQMRKSLLLLLKSRARRDNFSRKIHKKVIEQFDWDKSVDKLLRITGGK